MTALEDTIARCRDIDPDALYCGPTAAVLHGMPLPRRLEDDPRLHVLSLDPALRSRDRRLVGHRTTAGVAVDIRSGILVTAPVPTWLQLASLLPLHDLIVAGDRLLRWRDPLATREEIGAAVDAAPGARGILRARAALAAMRERSRSPRETRVRLALSAAGLPEPELNVRIELPSGRVYHGDLAYVRARVLLEYEGDQHRLDDRQWAHDLERYNDFSAAGWIVIRVSRHANLAAVAASAARALRDRGAP